MGKLFRAVVGPPLHCAMSRTRIPRLEGAFPAECADAVAQVATRMPQGLQDCSADDIGQVTLGGEHLHIPARQYFLRPDVTAGPLSDEAQAILACFYTRHHDGYVREKYLRQIVCTPFPWVAPYVVQLLGEYVLELILVIHANLDTLPRTVYSDFIRENPAFMALTRSRATSYWNCYHRGIKPQYRRVQDYPAMTVLNQMTNW